MQRFFNTSSSLILGWVFLGIGILILINPYFIRFWVGDQYYLGMITSILFGTYVIVDLVLLPHRIVLTSSLYHIREQATFRFLQATVRVVIILLFLHQFQTNTLPASLLISAILVQICFFYFQVKRYFKERNILIYQNHLLIIVLLVATLLLLMIADLMQYFS